MAAYMREAFRTGSLANLADLTAHLDEVTAAGIVESL